MTRIIFTAGDGATTWFDPDSAEQFHAEKEWDGANMVSVITRDWATDEILHRTRSGRWILERWTRWEGSTTTYSELTADQARAWLILSQANDDAVERYWGPIPNEPTSGRPAIGDQVKIAFPADLLAQIDETAKREGVTRSEWIRRACAATLTGKEE